MMAHPEEAAEAPASLNGQAAVDAFESALGDDLDVQDEQDYTDQELEAGEPEEDGGEQETDEPDTPAIAPPVSLTADEKESFSSLPVELQQAVAAIETRRNAQVQEATTKAANAQRDARSDAALQVSELQQSYADQLSQYAAAFEVPRPDYSLLATDPQAYAQEAALYEQAQAHRAQIAEQADHARQLAAQQKAAWQAHQTQLVQEAIPEWRDPAKLQSGITALVNVGIDFGFEASDFEELSAADVMKLHKLSELVDYKAKFEALNAKQMERVRSFKGKGPISKPGVAQSRSSITRGNVSSAIDRLSANPNNRQAGEDAFAAIL
jgi:hypothetical protein